MSLDRASETELLRSARRTLLEILLPSLPPDLRYEGLMVANALAISLREVTGGSDAVLAVLRSLVNVLGEDMAKSASQPGAPEAIVATLERRLAAEIRRGAFDQPGPGRETARAALGEITAERAKLSNPKALSSG